MKAITLTQPFASLVANGDKLVETRTWQTSYRGPLLVHAAATLKGRGGGKGTYVETLHRLPDLTLLRLSELAPYKNGIGVVPPGLPLGEVVAVTYLEDVEPIDDFLRLSLSADELAVGDYRDGRYAWRLRRALDDFRPFPYKGKLGLWDVPDEDLPDRVARACRAICHAVS